MVIREPFAKRRKSRRPWPIIVLFVRSITEGRGPRDEGGERSPLGKRLGPPLHT